MTKKCYVYFHINPLKNEVFYIGKGTHIKGRSPRYSSKYGRNQHWERTVKKYGFIVDVVHDNLTEAEAFELETFYINFYGRRDLGLGKLVNMTDGGEGTNVWSAESRKKASESKKQAIASGELKINVRLKDGAKRSKEECAKVSATLKAKYASGEIIHPKGTLGFKHSEESRKKMSDSQKGRVVSQETRDKQSADRKAKYASGELIHWKLKLKNKNQ